MMLAGLKTRFVAELMELYGEAVGPSEHLRLSNRFSTKHQRWFGVGAKSLGRPEFLPLDDVEELLLVLEDSAANQGNRYEVAVASVVDRTIARRTWAFGHQSTRSALGRLVPLIEELWPFRPPSISIEDTATGLRIAMTLRGYSRCTRLLTYQLLGALSSAQRVSASAGQEALHTTVDFFGDRARIDVTIRSTCDTLPVADSEPVSRRPSARVRLFRPSLAEEVESILGHRPSSQQPPPSGLPSQSPSNRPPVIAIGMGPLQRPSQPAQESVRPVVTAQSGDSSPSSNRPSVTAPRRSTPPPLSTHSLRPPEPSGAKQERPSDRPSTARLRNAAEGTVNPPSSSPPSRRGGQSG